MVAPFVELLGLSYASPSIGAYSKPEHNEYQPISCWILVLCQLF